MRDLQGIRDRLMAIARRDTILDDFAEQEKTTGAVSNAELAGKLDTRTTVIAFRTADGAIVAADSRGTLGSRPQEGGVKKLFVLDEFSTFGISGFAGDGQLIARLIEREFERFANRFHPPHPKSKANRVAAYLRAFGGCVPVFVTYDHAENRARIFSYDAAGSIVEMTNGYASVGSGAGPIRSQIESFAPVIAATTAASAVPSVVYLLRQAVRHDMYTGGDFLIHLVTAEGIAELVVPEALWRLDAVLGAAYDPEIEIKILSRVLRYAEDLQKKYAASQKEDAAKDGDAT